MKKQSNELFESRRNGFAIRFDNGVLVSVMFGHGFLCELRDSPYKAYNSEFQESSCADAEVYVCRNRSNIIDQFPFFEEKKQNGVYAYTKPDELLLLLMWAENMEFTEEE